MIRIIRFYIAAALLVFLAPAVVAENPLAVSLEMKEGLPLARASVNGKYRNLLRVISVPHDRASYGDFSDWGYYTGSEWQGHKNLPAGHWVYVYPRWYIWGEMAK